MAFTGNATCDVFKQALLSGSVDFAGGQYYLALYTNEASLGAATTEYTATGEVVADGYTAGGELLTPTSVALGDGTSYISFADVSWSAALSGVRGALIYTPGANGAVCVLDFGSDKISTTTFTVQFPANTATSAIIRIA
jgi:hypothetical protein